MPLRKIAFVVEDFITGAPSQQLLDRFLLGYARDGEFRRVPELHVTVWTAPPPENSSTSFEAATSLAVRARDLKLIQAPTLETALDGADAVVVVAHAERVCVNEELLKNLLQRAASGTVCFVHGCLATTLTAARRLTALAQEREIVLTAGTSVATTFRLPDVDLALDTPLAEALIVVQGPRPLAELWGIDGLSPILARRAGGESGLRSERRLDGPGVWRAADKGEWSWALLAAALSRSNTAQGDPVSDGRTQDLVGLGRVRKLAREPRGWLLDHRDGLRSAVLVLDGVVADFNFAVRTRTGTVLSAQLYRPPPPNRAEFDRLAAVIEDFAMTRNAPWPAERALVVADFLSQVPV